MKKFAIAFAVVCAVIASAKAEMLYWQVSESNYRSGTFEGTRQSRLYYYDGTQMNLLGAASGVSQGQYDTGWAPTGVNLTDSSYTFWIETGSYANSGNASEPIANSAQYYGAFRYDQLALSGTQLTAANMRAIVNNAGVHTGHVPEPTSGLMMLVGMALLGLKRRRV